jgi:hypothetical protein
MGIFLGTNPEPSLEPISKLKCESLSVLFERHGINERHYFQGFCMLFAIDALVQSGALIENRF